MFETPFKLAWTGALLVGVPVYTATKIDPSQTLNAILYGSVAWGGLNLLSYIKTIANEPLVESFDEDDLSEAFTDGYLSARESVGMLSRQREKVIRDYYEDKLSSVGDKTKQVINNITNNDYSTINNINAVPQIEDNNVIDTKLIGA